MALPYDVEVSFLDGNGNTARMRYHVSNADDIADIATDAIALVTALDANSDARVTDAHIKIPIDISGSTRKANPTADSDNEKGGVLVFADADGLIYRMRVPAVKDTSITDNSKALDQTAFANVISYFTGITGTAHTTTKAGTVLTGLRSARQNFKKNYKGRRT